MTISLVDFLPEFFEAFTERITQDQERWGNEWLRRPIVATKKWDSQDDRIFSRFDEYFEAFFNDGVPINQETWLRIIGNAFIAWVRLNHPELFPYGGTLSEEEIDKL